MPSPRRARRALPLACVAVLATLSPAAAVAPPTPVQRFSLGLGLTVDAPPAGFGVTASAALVAGGHLDLVLETGADGIARSVPEAPAAAMAPSAVRIAGSPSACQDGRYHLLPTKWKSTWEWWFQAGSTPPEITRNKAERALKSAVGSITGSRNDCGRADKVNARATYRGRTTTKPGVGSNLGCPKHDGKNVVGFGNLPAGVLALTCTVYLIVPGVDTSIESDVLFNKDDYSWTTTLAGCTNGAMLRSVATHEFGHVFGLNHVSEVSHGKLTMSTSIGPCDDSAFTLGKGDMLGLQRRYPPK